MVQSRRKQSSNQCTPAHSSAAPRAFGPANEGGEENGRKKIEKKAEFFPGPPTSPALAFALRSSPQLFRQQHAQPAPWLAHPATGASTYGGRIRHKMRGAAALRAPEGRSSTKNRPPVTAARVPAMRCNAMAAKQGRGGRDCCCPDDCVRYICMCARPTGILPSGRGLVWASRDARGRATILLLDHLAYDWSYSKVRQIV